MSSEQLRPGPKTNEEEYRQAIAAIHDLIASSGFLSGDGMLPGVPRIRELLKNKHTEYVLRGALDRMAKGEALLRVGAKYSARSQGEGTSTAAPIVKIVYGFASACEELIGLQPRSGIFSVMYRENRYDPKDAQSATVIDLLEDAIVNSETTGPIKLSFLLESSQFSPAKILRLVGLEEGFVKHCATEAERIEDVPDHSLFPKSVWDSLGDMSREDLEALEEDQRFGVFLTQSLKNRMLEVDGWLRNNYLRLEDFGKAVSKRLLAQKELSWLEVRAYRLWSSSPVLILNEMSAVVGMYPANKSANNAPAMLIHLPGNVEDARLKTVIDDFKSSYAQSATVLRAGHREKTKEPTVGCQYTALGEQLRKAMTQAEQKEAIQTILSLVDNFAVRRPVPKG